ncbi:MAG: DNA-processing protein DprA [Algoriphagus sp.]|nr:DNA-processing protein DprA [Algoriphagus sp.]
MNSIQDPTPEDKQHFIALALAPKVGPVLFKAIVAYAGSALAFFSFSQAQVAKIPRIGRRLLEIRLQRDSLLSQAASLISNQEKVGYRLLTAIDKDFPNRLNTNPDAPVLLFTKGAANLNAARTVGIVGTRSATPYGKAITKKICEDLLPYQPSIVSGLAFGIDIEAHRVALNLGLPTIAVLGSPIQQIYPAAHQGTASQLVQENGALLSEYGPGSKMLPGNFPARNRIIALLSDALLVVEAAEKGGALITAELAYGYQKEVFAVPGNLQATFSEGCNQLIRKMKAAIYTGPEDLAEALHWTKPGEERKPKPLQDFSNREEEEFKIVTHLQTKGATELDQLAHALQIPLGRLSAKLLSLEFEGIIQSLPGKKYKLLV